MDLQVVATDLTTAANTRGYLQKPAAEIIIETIALL